MNEFINTNYMRQGSAIAAEGVYHLKNRQAKSFYFVRVILPHRPGLPTTIAKCKTKEEATKIFIERTGKENVPFHEIIKNKGKTKKHPKQ